ncbi:MAG: tRNA ((37)-N6)-threonylcarbamoyltransferase complex ATPase subunit type 1 TsaE [Bacteroidota bacterium]|jgi:tRNA threonylcarbamoyladenosine biosynthesis protein TsaE|nr:tRNA (adenosine(37)-N6)-threonylcarbamoyltransferase complex ATPase subunit type 1 TsaE [Chitinophagia bacterium]
MMVLDQEYGMDELPLVANKLAEFVSSYHLFTFEGDLGAGKTTLVKAICDTLGVWDKVASPTYSLINQYQASKENRTFPVFHIDLYRLDSAEEAYHAGVEEIIQSNDLCLVEWPQRLPDLLDGRRIEVRLRVSASGGRRIQVYSHEN